MSRREPFGDVEVALVEFGEASSWGYVVTSTPEDLYNRITAGEFVVRVGRQGGSDSSNATVDVPRVSVQVFGRREGRVVHDHAAQIRADLLSLSGYVTAAGRLDSAETESGPTVFPWPDEEVLAVQMIFRLRTRR